METELVYYQHRRLSHRQKAEGGTQIGCKKRGSRFGVPSNYAACRLRDMYPRRSKASRPVASVKLWLPQPSMFRVRVSSEFASVEY